MSRQKLSDVNPWNMRSSHHIVMIEEEAPRLGLWIQRINIGGFHTWRPQNSWIFWPLPPYHCHKSADFVPFVCFLGTPSPHPLRTSYMEAPLCWRHWMGHVLTVTHNQRDSNVKTWPGSNVLFWHITNWSIIFHEWIKNKVIDLTASKQVFMFSLRTPEFLFSFQLPQDTVRHTDWIEVK